MIFKERLTAVANFFHFANTVKDETAALIENILEQGEINIDEEKSNAYDMYSKAYNYAIILVPVHVSDYMFDIDNAILDLESLYNDIQTKGLNQYPEPLIFDTTEIERQKRLY